MIYEIARARRRGGRRNRLKHFRWWKTVLSGGFSYPKFRIRCFPRKTTGNLQNFRCNGRCPVSPLIFRLKGPLTGHPERSNPTSRPLQPWFENLGKRQLRSPKVYIIDSGLRTLY